MRQSARLGSSVFSVADIYPKIAALRTRIAVGEPLYFVKVDATDCFNSIPQPAMTRLLHSLLASEQYSVAFWTEFTTASRWHYNRIGNVVGGFEDFATSLRVGTRPRKGGKHAVLIDGVTQSRRYRSTIVALFEEHMTNNIVKIGSKHYRQRQGIPQGSVLSTLLCSFFYGEFERSHLRFLHDGDNGNKSVLVRLVDDFLLITSEMDVARRFLDVMLAGSPEFGVRVREDKTLCNFEASFCGRAVRSLPQQQAWFPYCGLAVHTQTLDVRKTPAALGPEGACAVAAALDAARRD